MDREVGTVVFLFLVEADTDEGLERAIDDAIVRDDGGGGRGESQQEEETRDVIAALFGDLASADKEVDAVTGCQKQF